VTGRLRARTRLLDADVDLVTIADDHGVLWEGQRTSFAGRGVAQRVRVPRTDPGGAAAAVAAAFGAFDVDDAVDRVGTGLVAVGAFAFDPTIDGELLVPAVTVGVGDDGEQWVTTVLDAAATDADHDRAVDELLGSCGPIGFDVEGFSAAEPFAPSSFELVSVRSPEAWTDAVGMAIAALRDGAADKVVLAREVSVTADAPIPVAAILRRLRAAFPHCLRFSIDGFVGASPELLVARRDDTVRCHPMAGTAPRSGDPVLDRRLADELLASPKNQIEHRHTIDLVHEVLLPFCSYLDEEAEPSIVAMANVQHLATAVEGRLSSPPASIIELVGALHPTPAVCGRPRQAALVLIAEHEGLDRGRYAGPVGWVDHRGNGAFAVGIRSAEIDGATARVLAGVGVVADSDPITELAETRAKLQAMLAAIVRP